MFVIKNRDYSFFDAFFFFTFSGSFLLLPFVALGTVFILVFYPVDARADDLSCLSGGYVCWWDNNFDWPYAYAAVECNTLTGTYGSSESPYYGERSRTLTLFGAKPGSSSYKSFAIGVVKFLDSPSFSAGDYYLSSPTSLAFSYKNTVSSSGKGPYFTFDVFSTASTTSYSVDSYICIKDSSGNWHKVSPASGYFSVDYSFDEIYFYCSLSNSFSFSGRNERYWGFTSLPKFFKVTQVTNQDVINQTESLKDTTGADNSFSDVVTSNSQSDFDTRLGAVSQVVDISGQLFTAVLDGSEGDGIPFSGYSVTLPVGGTLSVPSSSIDVWSFFPDAETPVRTALTLMLVIAWVHGVYRWYESIVSPGDES